MFDAQPRCTWSRVSPSEIPTSALYKVICAYEAESTLQRKALPSTDAQGNQGTRAWEILGGRIRNQRGILALSRPLVLTLPSIQMPNPDCLTATTRAEASPVVVC